MLSRQVATPLDTASPHFNQSFYSFLPRCVYGGLRSALDIESQRCHNAGVPWFHGELAWDILTSAGMGWTFYAVFGPAALAMFLIQSFVGTFHARKGKMSRAIIV